MRAAVGPDIGVKAAGGIRDLATALAMIDGGRDADRHVVRSRDPRRARGRAVSAACPAYPLRALVLRKTKLGEADLILTLLAEDGRQVRAVAKGARKPKSRIGARVEPFTVLDLLLHTGRTLDIIAEAQTVASHEELRRDLDRSAHAAVVADVLDKSVGGGADRRAALRARAGHARRDGAAAPLESLLVVTDAFLVKAMAMHGYRPQLGSCVSCALR